VLARTETGCVLKGFGRSKFGSRIPVRLASPRRFAGNAFSPMPARTQRAIKPSLTQSRGSIPMKRGEIWTVSGGPDYAGKPRPVVIVQSEAFEVLDSVTICPFTTDPTELPLFRLDVVPSGANGLRATSRIMVDKVSTIPKTKLGDRIGQLVAADIVRINRALIVFLGLAD
jgi:mRNA interferase MazF